MSILQLLATMDDVMTKWEYKVINTYHEGVPLVGPDDLHYHERLARGLSVLGDDGWELCGLYNNMLIFKRQLPNGVAKDVGS